jgi:lipopolysaccharide export system protein LptA
MTARQRNCRRVLPIIAAAVAIIAAAIGDAGAQATRPPSAPRSAAPVPQGPPNALQGFSQNHDQPVRIESDSLDVRTKDNVATFTGKVHVVQGDTDLRSQSLVVFYEDNDAKGTGVRTAKPGPGGNSQIKRLEAIGNVVVTQKDQTVTGDKGVFEMRANTVTLSGNVVLSQCQNVMRGERLIVDLTTGASRVEGGRVQGLFQRGSGTENCKDAAKMPGSR